MRVKIRGGTVNDGEPPLCQTCRFATIVKGTRLRDEIVECANLMFGRARVRRRFAKWKKSPGFSGRIRSGTRSDSCARPGCANASDTC
jgi:hypothetical protein